MHFFIEGDYRCRDIHDEVNESPPSEGGRAERTGPTLEGCAFFPLPRGDFQVKQKGRFDFLETASKITQEQDKQRLFDVPETELTGLLGAAIWALGHLQLMLLALGLTHCLFEVIFGLGEID